MIERELSAIMRGVAPVLKEQVDGIATRLIREAEQAEALRTAEHRALMAEYRAWMAEQKAAADALTRRVDERLATVRDGIDGRDGVDGKDGRDGIDGQNGTDGADGVDGKDGEPGAPGRDGIDGKDGENGRDGVDGAPGRDGIDAPTIAKAEVIEGALLVELTDGRTINAGLVRGADGKDGRDGVDGKDAYAGEARGLFDPAAEYRAMDVVSFNGCEWRAKRDAPGELPGDGWMLSASRGKRGDRGERGLTGKDGSTVVAFYREPGSSNLVLTKDDGTELKADLGGDV